MILRQRMLSDMRSILCAIVAINASSIHAAPMPNDFVYHDHSTNTVMFRNHTAMLNSLRAPASWQRSMRVWIPVNVAIAALVHWTSSEHPCVVNSTTSDPCPPEQPTMSKGRSELWTDVLTICAVIFTCGLFAGVLRRLMTSEAHDVPLVVVRANPNMSPLSKSTNRPKGSPRKTRANKGDLQFRDLKSCTKAAQSLHSHTGYKPLALVAPKLATRDAKCQEAAHMLLKTTTSHNLPIKQDGNAMCKHYALTRLSSVEPATSLGLNQDSYLDDPQTFETSESQSESVGHLADYEYCCDAL